MRTLGARDFSLSGYLVDMSVAVVQRDKPME